MEVQTGNVSGTKSGTTTSTTVYTEVARFDTRGCGWQGKTVVFVTNKSGTQTLHYKIDGYVANTSGAALPLKAATSVPISTTTTDTTSIVYPYGVIILSVKGNSGQPIDWTVEWTTY